MRRILKVALVLKSIFCKVFQMSCNKELCQVRPGPAIGNYLGFSGVGVAQCCTLPCPALPIHNVTICILLNCDTVVKIQQGCSKASDAYDSDDSDDCRAVYSCGQTYDSWGRKCRVVTWQRKVTDDAFVRLRFCGHHDCEAVCGDTTRHHGRGRNQLLKYEIDGADVKRIIAAVNKQQGGIYKCIQANCTVPSNDNTSCCYVDEQTGVPSWDLSDIPHGAQIVVGPMNEVPFSYPPPILA